MAKQTDRWPNLAAITVTESAANTLTFQQLQTGGVLFERRAMVLHQVEYYHSAASIAAAADSINLGISTNNTMSSITAADPNVVDWMVYRRLDFGTAASGQLYTTPTVRDFSNLPGGGLIVPAFPIYGFVQGESLAGAQTVRIRVRFTVQELAPAEFIELVEATRMVT